MRVPSTRWVYWRRGDDGSVAAETVLVTPFLIMSLIVVGVVIHRGVDARIRVDDAAHQAARAATIERNVRAANTAAQATASTALDTAGVVCSRLTVSTSAGEFRPGGVVTVTVACDVDLGGALVLGVPVIRRLSATAVEQIDVWRSVEFGRRI